MVQTKRKTNVIALAIVLSLMFVFGIVAAVFATPATETAYAGTATIESLSLANINAGNAQGKYGNFSWDNTKIKSISASEMTTDRDEDPLCIVWTRPTNGAYASALTFSVNVTDSVGAITIRYDASVPSYISPGEKQSGTLTETVNSLSSTYEKIYFYISCSYMYNDVHLTSVSIQIKATTYKMTFTKGAGIKDAYLSTDSTATSGSASGTEFAKFSTVYCFAKLADGYKAQNGWTLINGTANSEDAIYRVGTRSNISATYNFGTINAVEKQKYLYRNLNGGGSISGIDLTYNQTANLTVPGRTGYTFNGWNTNAAGTGTAYGNSTDATLTAEQVNAIIADDSITCVYAQWEANEYNVIVNGENQNLTYGSNFDLTPPTPEEGYTFRGYFDGENGTGTQYTDVDGHSIRSWDKAEDDTHLYAYFTKDMTVVSVGYEADYDGEAHGITINVTDPADGYTILYGEIENSYTLESLTKTDAGTYTVYFKVTKTGYNDYCGSAVITINKIDAVVTAPTAKTGLHYTGVAQELVNAGSTTGGTIEYKLNDGEWSTDIPTAVNVDDNYIVSYRVVGGTNFNDIVGVALSEPIEIEQVDKSALSALIEDVNAYYGAIHEAHPEIAATLEGHKQQIANDYFMEENVTEAQIASAITALQGYLDDAEIAVTEELIDAIGEVDLTKEAAIDAALEAYSELTPEEQANVANRDDLFDAVVALVEALIDDIPDPVVYTTACGDKIAKARDFFDDLTEAEQALVENKQDLFDAEAAYKALDDAAKANAAKALIEAIGEVEDTQSSKDKIDAARAAYDALTDDQKALITEDAPTLVTAETTYNTLHNNNLAAAEVIALIEAIGEVEDTQSSKDKIDAAREAYDALTDDQKALITEDAPTIVTAETTYNTLHNNNLAAAEVIALIEQIGTVEYTDTSKNKIDTAKEAYNDLTDAQKAIVDGYLTENEVDTIVVSETIYIGLGDQQKAQEVKDLIVAIGEVKYPDSKDKIEAAREGYDGLTDAQKPLVDNYETLTTAETTYAGLEAQANKKLSGGAIAGIVIACVVFVCGLCVLVLFLLKKKQDKEGARPAPVHVVDDEPKDDQTDELEG